jgi:hypothetical protein
MHGWTNAASPMSSSAGIRDQLDKGVEMLASIEKDMREICDELNIPADKLGDGCPICGADTSVNQIAKRCYVRAENVFDRTDAEWTPSAKDKKSSPYADFIMCDACSINADNNNNTPKIPITKSSATQTRLCAFCIVPNSQYGGTGSEFGLCNACFVEAPCDEKENLKIRNHIERRFGNPVWMNLFGVSDIDFRFDETKRQKSEEKKTLERADVVMILTMKNGGRQIAVTLEIDNNHQKKPIMIKDYFKNESNMNILSGDDAIHLGFRMVPSNIVKQKGEEHGSDPEKMTAAERWSVFGTWVDCLLRMLQAYNWMPGDIPGWIKPEENITDFNRSRILVYLFYSDSSLKWMDPRFNSIFVGPKSFPSGPSGSKFGTWYYEAFHRYAEFIGNNCLPLPETRLSFDKFKRVEEIKGPEDTEAMEKGVREHKANIQEAAAKGARKAVAEAKKVERKEQAAEKLRQRDLRNTASRMSKERKRRMSE